MVGEVTTGFLIHVIDKFSKPLANAEKSIKKITNISSGFTKTLKKETIAEKALSVSLSKKDKALLDSLNPAARAKVMEELGIKTTEEKTRAIEKQTVTIGRASAFTKLIAKSTLALIVASAAANERFSDMKLRLEGVTGSAKDAENIFEKLKTFSEKVPSSLSDIVNANVALIAFTGSEKKAEKITRQLSTVSGAYGDSLDALVKNYERVEQAGRFGKTELRQLSPQSYAVLIRAMKQIAKEHHRNIKDFDNALRTGKLSAEWYTKALEIATAKGGVFYKTLQKRNESFMSSLKEFVAISSVYLDDIWKMIFGNVTIGKEFHKLNNFLIMHEKQFSSTAHYIGVFVSSIAKAIEYTSKFVYLIAKLSGFMSFIKFPFKAIGAGADAIKQLGGSERGLVHPIGQSLKHHFTITVSDPKGYVKHTEAKSEDRRTQFNLGTNMMHVLG